MARYMEVSTQVYRVYLKYVAPEDIHVYSVDEVFMDVTAYLGSYKMNAHQLAMTIIRDVLKTTGITATAGIGTNLYLAKVAMDIVAKHIPADKDGVRIGELDEMSYRQQLWDHKPLTSFWRVGKGIAAKLQQFGIDTMGKLARMSLTNEDFLFRLFGINAELLIDHAWGWEPCKISEIKAFRPERSSIGHGQVLQRPYKSNEALVVAKEMVEMIALELVSKRMMTNMIVITIGYDRESLKDKSVASQYKGEITRDYYGRSVPKHAHGTTNLPEYTSSTKLMTDAVEELYLSIVNPTLLIRRINITACKLAYEDRIAGKQQPRQLDLFLDNEKTLQEEHERSARRKKERRIQEAQLAIKRKFGKNAILRGLNLAEGATAKDRNQQIGGHKA